MSQILRFLPRATSSGTRKLVGVGIKWVWPQFFFFFWYALRSRTPLTEILAMPLKPPFTPLVLSAIGGVANEATIFYRRLASCLAGTTPIACLCYTAVWHFPSSAQQFSASEVPVQAVVMRQNDHYALTWPPQRFTRTFYFISLFIHLNCWLCHALQSYTHLYHSEQWLV